jgi:hypothetical protein
MIKVQATKLGFYGNRRRRIGDTFKIANEQAFSKTWMNRLDEKKDVLIDAPKDEDTTKEETLTVAKPEDGGDCSPPEQTTENNNKENDSEGDQDSRQPEIEIKSSDKFEQLSENKLKNLNRDDLIAKAVEIGLSENIDLTQLKKADIAHLIIETYNASGNES